MAKQSDPIAAALDAVTAPNLGGVEGKIMALYRDRPEVLDAIERARRDRKLSYAQIAKVLSGQGDPVSAGAIASFLAKRGID